MSTNNSVVCVVTVIYHRHGVDHSHDEAYFSFVGTVSLRTSRSGRRGVALSRDRSRGADAINFSVEGVGKPCDMDD